MPFQNKGTPCNTLSAGKLRIDRKVAKKIIGGQRVCRQLGILFSIKLPGFDRYIGSAPPGISNHHFTEYFRSTYFIDTHICLKPQETLQRPKLCAFSYVLLCILNKMVTAFHSRGFVCFICKLAIPLVTHSSNCSG